MADPNEFRDDAKILKAIERNRKMMEEPEGVDLEEAFRKCMEAYRLERELTQGFARAITHVAHRKDSWLSRLRVQRSFDVLDGEIGHILACPKCQNVLAHSGKAMECIKMVPEVVTLEDGEKAIQRLAKNMNMTEAEFRAWIGKTSDRIIREMNTKGTD